MCVDAVNKPGQKCAIKAGYLWKLGNEGLREGENRVRELLSGVASNSLIGWLLAGWPLLIAPFFWYFLASISSNSKSRAEDDLAVFSMQESSRQDSGVEQRTKRRDLRPNSI
jgi:hypothetical protein